MITRRELEALARKQKLSLGNAEKDYLLDLVLSIISKNSNSLILKGGTCLYKFHSLPRFSEDLDFSAKRDIGVNALMQRIIKELESKGIQAVEQTRKEPYNSILITLKIKGPLFTGVPRSYASIGIDLNLKSEVILPAQELTYSPIYPEVGPITLHCLRIEETFAEKIRAILTRNKARDLFDLNFLIQQNIFASKELIDKKLEYYQETFSLQKLIEKIDSFKLIWQTEILALSRSAPVFEQVSVQVKQKLRELYS